MVVKRCVVGLFVLLGLLLASTLQAAQPMVLGERGVTFDQGELSILEDEVHSLQWRDARKAYQRGEFRQIPHGVGEGYRNSAFWIYTTLARPAEITPDWAFMISPAYLDRVDFYLIHNGQLVDQFAAGDQVVDSEHDLHHRIHLVGTTLPEGESELLMRLHTTSTSALLLQAIPQQAVSRVADARALTEGLMIGVLIMVLVINFINGVWLRRTLFLYFVFYEACLLSTILMINSITLELFPSMTPEEQNLYMQVGVMASGLTAFLFFMRMLDFPFRGSRWVRGCFWGGVFISLMGLSLTLYGHFVDIMGGINLFVVTFPYFALVPLVKAWSSLNPEQKYRAGGCFVFGFFVSGNSLFTLGWLPVVNSTTYIPPVMILSFQLCLHFIIMFAIRKTEDSYKETERQLSLAAYEAESERALRQSHEMFLDMFAHEVRTPLAVIDSSAQMLPRLEEKPDGAALREQRYQRIRGGVTRINQLLELSLVRGRAQLDESIENVSRLDFEQLATEVKREFSDRQQRRIEWNIPAKIVSFRSRISAQLLGIVIKNLLDNALKYSTDDKSVFVHIWRDRLGLVIRVWDQGDGISEYAQKNMFKRFYRADERKSIAGLGLGLFVTKEVVERFGGRIEVESNASGTCITCHFIEGKQ